MSLPDCGTFRSIPKVGAPVDACAVCALVEERRWPWEGAQLCRQRWKAALNRWARKRERALVKAAPRFDVSSAVVTFRGVEYSARDLTYKAAT